MISDTEKMRIFGKAITELTRQNEIYKEKGEGMLAMIYNYEEMFKEKGI